MCNEFILYNCERREERYLRVHSILRIPAMALQHPDRGVPVELSEANELLNRSLLLRAVNCWHLVLAPYVRPQVLVGSRVEVSRNRGVAGGSRKAEGEGW